MLRAMHAVVPRRPTDPEFAEKDAASFSDGFPMLLISDASLDGLNAQLLQPPPGGGGQKNKLTMNRFRPNVTVSGCEPFAEDEWGSVLIGGKGYEGRGGEGEGGGGNGGGGGGGVPCDFVKPCSRCTITTVDQSTGKFSTVGQPLTTLGKIRSGAACGFATETSRKEWMNSPMFGWNIVSRAEPGAVIRVGNVVSVTTKRKFV